MRFVDRPRDLPADLIARAGRLTGHGKTGYLVRLLAYYWALDWNDIPAADGALAFALAQQPAPPSNEWVILQLEVAYFYARYGKNPDQAAIYLNAAQPYLHDVPNIFQGRMLAGYYLATGEAERASSLAEHALNEIAAVPQSQQPVAEREWLNQILVEARSVLNTTEDRSEEHTVCPQDSP